MKIKKCRAEIEHCGFSSYFKDLLPTSVSKKSRALVRSPGIDMMAARKLCLCFILPEPVLQLLFHYSVPQPAFQF